MSASMAAISVPNICGAPVYWLLFQTQRSQTVAAEGSALTFLYFFPRGSFAKTLQELPF